MVSLGALLWVVLAGCSIPHNCLWDRPLGCAGHAAHWHATGVVSSGVADERTREPDLAGDDVAPAFPVPAAMDLVRVARGGWPACIVDELRPSGAAQQHACSGAPVHAVCSLDNCGSAGGDDLHNVLSQPNVGTPGADAYPPPDVRGVCPDFRSPPWKLRPPQAMATLACAPSSYFARNVLCAAQEFPASRHIELPGLAPRNAWVEAFEWVRGNTPRNAFFALDPKYMEKSGDDYHGFRGIAERSMLADDVKDTSVVEVFRTWLISGNSNWLAGKSGRAWAWMISSG